MNLKKNIRTELPIVTGQKVGKVGKVGKMFPTLKGSV